jgi:AraC-like DNA-binding protein
MDTTSGFPVEPAWQALLADFGLKRTDILREASLPLDLFSRERVQLSPDEFVRFWNAVERAVDNPRFPVMVGGQLARESFVPAFFAARCSPDYCAAVDRLAHYKRLVAPVALSTERSSATFEVRYQWLSTTVRPPATFAAAELVFMTALIRSGTRDSELSPLRVSLPPLPARVKRELQSYFSCEPEVRDRISITFDANDAERPFLTADDAMWEHFEPILQGRLEALDEATTFRQKVRALLLESLPSGRSTMNAVARQLAVSNRTLQRRLQREDTSFQEVLGETRESLARHYLAETSLTCSQISFLLGYDDPNSFSRAFVQWTGETAESVREAQP